MAHLRRPIHGPDARTERPQTYRPVRTGAERRRDILLGEGAAFVLAGASLGALVAPALAPFLLPAGALFALPSLLRKTRLPLRLPATASRRDTAHRNRGKAAGAFFIGNDIETGQELWQTVDDVCEHASFSGGTGSGKTRALLARCANALMMGSGCVFIDAKGDAKLVAEFMALCRRTGRDKDLRVVNFLVASGDRDSHSFNPFQYANADAIREMILSQLAHAGSMGGGDNAVFKEGVRSLLSGVLPVLRWMADHKGLRLDIEAIESAVEMKALTALAYDGVFLSRDRAAGAEVKQPVRDLPPRLVAPIKAYLGQRGGYDEDLHHGRRQDSEPAKQHSFVHMHLGSVFSHMAVSLGHIFNAAISDIDMRDVGLNRRVLLVRLPALENADETSVALGKLMIAAVRGMMAQALGGRLEGHYDDIVGTRPSHAKTPFVLAFDELAAMLGPGLDVLLQQARELKFAACLGWHDVESLESRIGQGAATLLNNTTTTVWMRQNLGGKTRQTLEGTVGDAEVTHLARYDTRGGVPSEAHSLEVRRLPRVDWRDTREQQAGQGIVCWANVRRYADLLYVAPDPKGPMRLIRPVPLPVPKPGEAKAAHADLERVRARLLAPLPRRPAAQPPPDLAAFLEGLRCAQAAGLQRHEAAAAAVLAVGKTPYQPDTLPRPEDGARTEFSAALDAVAAAPKTPPEIPPEIEPAPKIPPAGEHMAGLAAAIADLEQMLGTPADEALARARRAVSAHDAATDPARLPRPPAMDSATLKDLLSALLRDLGGPHDAN